MNVKRTDYDMELVLRFSQDFLPPARNVVFKTQRSSMSVSYKPAKCKSTGLNSNNEKTSPLLGKLKTDVVDNQINSSLNLVSSFPIVPFV